MKIDDKTMTYEINNYYPKSVTDAAEKAGEKQASEEQKVEGKGQSDQDTIVNLSQSSKEAQRMEEVILSEPGVREEKVAEIKQKIESGTYEINHEKVAANLVDASLDEILKA